ncbi:MAG: O-antigen ligase family protein, partial [Gammaproteobacteria bacterium]
PRIADLLPFDLTVMFGLILYMAIVFRLRQYDWSSLPRMLWLYLPFMCLMIFSVYYSPLPAAGAEKALRFILLTGLAIIAPFFLVDTPSRMRNYFITTLVLCFAISLEPVSQIGTPVTDDWDWRIKVAGGNAIELGASAVVGVTIILFVLLPQLNKCARPVRLYLTKAFLYLMITVFVLALIGAAARSATVSLVAVVLLNAFFYRRGVWELLLVTCLAACSLLFIDIPEHAVEYLGTLIEPDVESLVGWRGHLMLRGLELIAEHPILGVGLGAFPYYGTIPPPEPWFVYNWPHNVIIEIGCEMGLAAAMIACVLIILAFVETFRQLADGRFQYKIYTRLSLACLIIGLISFVATGDINNQRPMWLYLSLPFVIRSFGSKRASEYLDFRHLPSGPGRSRALPEQHLRNW